MSDVDDVETFGVGESWTGRGTQDRRLEEAVFHLLDRRVETSWRTTTSIALSGAPVQLNESTRVQECAARAASHAAAFAFEVLANL